MSNEYKVGDRVRISDDTPSEMVIGGFIGMDAVVVHSHENACRIRIDNDGQILAVRLGYLEPIPDQPVERDPKVLVCPHCKAVQSEHTILTWTGHGAVYWNERREIYMEHCLSRECYGSYFHKWLPDRFLVAKSRDELEVMAKELEAKPTEEMQIGITAGSHRVVSSGDGRSVMSWDMGNGNSGWKMTTEPRSEPPRKPVPIELGRITIQPSDMVLWARRDFCEGYVKRGGISPVAMNILDRPQTLVVWGLGGECYYEVQP